MNIWSDTWRMRRSEEAMDGGGSIPGRGSSVCGTLRQDGAWIIQGTERMPRRLDRVRKDRQVMRQERLAEEGHGALF